MNDWRLRISWYICISESIGVKEIQFVFNGFKLADPSHWHMSFDVGVHAFCVGISSKVKVFCSFIVNLGVHMFGSWDQVAIVLQL